MTETVRFIDVSHHQPVDHIDYRNLKNEGIEALIARASYGRKQDETFVGHIARAKEAGLLVGAYHFLRFGPANQSLKSQLDAFLGAAVPALKDKSGFIVVDSEDNSEWDKVAVDSRNRGAYIETMREFIAISEAEIGKRMIVYTGPSWWKHQLGNPDFTSQPLWVAHYTTGGKPPTVPEPWTAWLAHQFTGSGSLDSVKGAVDINTYNGNAADMARLADFRLDGDPSAPSRDDQLAVAMDHYNKLGAALSEL